MDDYAKWLKKLSDKQLCGQIDVARAWLDAEKLHGARPRVDYAKRLKQLEAELDSRVKKLGSVDISA